ncbi:hypothetical protein HDU91_006502 [Kappamyces sp. JEL0680]|nr:hypothetical protein HDU91_006502 [Kappamyces sp. JEL0680]
MADGLLLYAAEFDIDKGSSVSFQYPPDATILEDKATLAELMLPELETISTRYHIAPPPLYVLNLVGTRQIPGARRGARVKSIAIAFRKPWVHVFKPVLMLALDEFFKNPVLDVIMNVYNALSNLDLPLLPVLSFSEKKVMRNFIRNKLAHFDDNFASNLENLVQFDAMDVPLEIMSEPFEYELPVL